MVRAWFLDKCSPESQSNNDVPSDRLALLGISCFSFFNAEAYEADPRFQELCGAAKYPVSDMVTMKTNGSSEAAAAASVFFKEHIHDDDEVRLCLEGKGYFDVRDQADQWIRIEMSPGTLMILPAGAYHRFSVDEQIGSIKMLRKFAKQLEYKLFHRPADDHPARVQYVQKYLKKSPPVIPSNSVGRVGKDFIGVGAGALVLDQNNRVLLLKRSAKARTHPGFWDRPGGAVEFGERAEVAVAREILEETGAVVNNVRFWDMYQDISASHWIALGFLADYASGEVRNVEPHKHEAVEWFSLDSLPEPITPYTLDAIQKLKLERQERVKTT